MLPTVNEMQIWWQVTNHHIIGVQWLYPFRVFFIEKGIPTLPLLSGGLLSVTISWGKIYSTYIRILRFKYGIWNLFSRRCYCTALREISIINMRLDISETATSHFEHTQVLFQYHFGSSLCILSRVISKWYRASACVCVFMCARAKRTYACECLYASCVCACVSIGSNHFSILH